MRDEQNLNGVGRRGYRAATLISSGSYSVKAWARRVKAEDNFKDRMQDVKLAMKDRALSAEQRAEFRATYKQMERTLRKRG